MGNHQADKKFTWVIKNYNSLDSGSVYSDTFKAGRCKWRLLAFPKGNNIYDYFFLYICVPNSESLPSGWRRRAKVSFTMVNQIPGGLSQQREAVYWFDEKETTHGFESMFLLSEIQSSDKGFLVNGEVKIVAEVDVLEVIGELDVPEEPERIDINGFQVPASQVESMNSLFEKYRGFASKIFPKNQHLRKTFLDVVLSMTEILCKSPEELSSGDLAEAYSALRFVTKAGFKLDWLEKKLKETGNSRLQEIEEDLKDLKVKCTDMDALLEFLR
ncbi:MATH domain and coiled-coil domain-containing protein [Arabidopsis thaliana]